MLIVLHTDCFPKQWFKTEQQYVAKFNAKYVEGGHRANYYGGSGGAPPHLPSNKGQLVLAKFDANHPSHRASLRFESCCKYVA